MIAKIGQIISTLFSFAGGLGVGYLLTNDDTLILVSATILWGLVGIKVVWDIMPKLIAKSLALGRVHSGLYYLIIFMSLTYVLSTTAIQRMMLKNQAKAIDKAYSAYVKDYKKIELGSKEKLISLEDKKTILETKKLNTEKKIANEDKRVASENNAHLLNEVKDFVYRKKYIYEDGTKTSKVNSTWGGWWQSNTAGCDIANENDVIECELNKRLSNISSEIKDNALPIELSSIIKNLEAIKKSIREEKERLKIDESDRVSKFKRIQDIENRAWDKVPSWWIIAGALFLFGLFIEGGLIASDVFIALGGRRPNKQPVRPKGATVTENMTHVMQNDDILDILTIFSLRERSVDAINQHEYVDAILPSVVHGAGNTRKGQVRADMNSLLGAIFVAVNKRYPSYKNVSVDEVFYVNATEIFKNSKGDKVIGFGSTNRNKKKGISPQEKAIRFLEQVEQKNEAFSPQYLTLDRLVKICDIYKKQ